MKLFLYIFCEVPFKNVRFQNIHHYTTYHYSGYQISKNDLGGACGSNGSEQRCM